MQLHIFGLLLMLVLMRRRGWAHAVLPALLVGAALAAGLVLHGRGLAPIITGQAPE